MEGAALDSVSLERFLESVERRAYRMAMVATADRDEALDIVQDVMLKLVRGYGDRAPGEWPPLFHTILQSTIKDWYRRRQVRNRFRVFSGGKDDDPPLEERAAAPTPGPGGETVNCQALSELDAALNQLPLRQQQVFLLRAWEGMSVAEAAHAMGCSEGSVKTHYSRAIHTLREKLEGHRP